MKKTYIAPRMGRTTEICEELICQSPVDGLKVYGGQRANTLGSSGNYSVDAESKDRSIDFSDEESIW